MQELSTEHLQNIRKILDSMAMNYASLIGGLEALKLLYPLFMNSPENCQVYNAVHNATAMNGILLPIYFAELSKNIGHELEKRKGKNQ